MDGVLDTNCMHQENCAHPEIVLMLSEWLFLNSRSLFLNSKSGRNRPTTSTDKENMLQPGKKIPGTFVCFSALTVKIGSSSVPENCQKI